MNTTDENTTELAYTETLPQLEQRARKAGCTLAVEFEITSGEITDEGISKERGSFVATFIPEPSLDVNRRYDAFYNDILELEVTQEDVDQLNAMMAEYETDCEEKKPGQFYEENMRGIREACGEVFGELGITTDPAIKQNNDLLNSWRVVNHDYNDDFTIEWTIDDDDVEDAKAMHDVDLEDEITKVVEELNKDANIAAFDKAKMDPESL